MDDSALFQHNPHEILRHFIAKDVVSSNHTEDQADVETVGFHGQISAEKVLGGFSTKKIMSTFLRSHDVFHFDNVFEWKQ